MCYPSKFEDTYGYVLPPKSVFMGMGSHSRQMVRCQVSGKEFPLDEVIPVDLVREGLAKDLQAKTPNWDPAGYVSLGELNKARAEHVDRILEDEHEDLLKLKTEVVNSIKEHELLARNADFEFEKSLSFGDRLSDKIADFGGSWTFILLFVGIIVVWTTINTGLLMRRPFDPYPFILLNLVLSCVAALQAPVIMMSQNRQEAKDRARGENDYKVNLKAEIEIRALNEKLDKLINDQWKHLLEIQQMQVDMIKEMKQ